MIDEEDRQGSKKLGLKYKKFRLDAQLTQAQLATKARVHLSYYSRIERGEANPRYLILCRIHQALGLKEPHLYL